MDVRADARLIGVEEFSEFVRSHGVVSVGWASPSGLGPVGIPGLWAGARRDCTPRRVGIQRSDPMKVGGGFNDRRSRTRKGAVKAPRNHGRFRRLKTKPSRDRH